MTTWTPQNIELLQTLWAEGMPSSAIAARLQTTRNAVIGKVNRLKIQRGAKILPQDVPQTAKNRADQFVTQNLRTYIPAKKKQMVVRKAPPPVPDLNLLIPMEALKPRQCRYPFDRAEGGGYDFCGLPVDGHRTYCPMHKALCILETKKEKIV